MRTLAIAMLALSLVALTFAIVQGITTGSSVEGVLPGALATALAISAMIVLRRRDRG